MYQLMIVDARGNIIGGYTDSSRLPDVKEVCPHGNYIGVETPYNLDLIFNPHKYIYKDGTFVKKDTVPYQATKYRMGPGESTTLFVPKDVIAVIEGVEYVIDDGFIEYSNPNVGTHQILLKLRGYSDTPVYIEVMEE